MTESLQAHLINNGLKVQTQDPFFMPANNVKAAYDNGDYYGSVTISWEEKATKPDLLT